VEGERKRKDVIRNGIFIRRRGGSRTPNELPVTLRTGRAALGIKKKIFKGGVFFFRRRATSRGDHGRGHLGKISQKRNFRVEGKSIRPALLPVIEERLVEGSLLEMT